MTPHQRRILDKLAKAWENAPTARLGQLLESVENIGWDMVNPRVHSPRLLWMGDDIMEAALDQWNGVPLLRKVVGT